MIKLQKAAGNEELLALKGAYQHRREINNLYLMNEWLRFPEAYRTISFFNTEDGMAAFKDEGDFYRVVFAASSGGYLQIPTLDKELCCDLVKIGGETVYEKTHEEQFLYNNGFSLIDCQEQLRFCCGSLHVQAMEKKESILRQLQEMHLQYVRAGIPELKEIRRLIRKEMGRYDAILLNDRALEVEAQKGNIVCLLGVDGIVAAYFCQPYSGWIVVSPDYRGKQLSKMLRLLFIAQKRWADSTENQYDWVSVDNEPSRRCLFSVGAVLTGKVKNRFLKASGLCPAAFI